MIDPATFFKGFGIAFVILLLFAGFGYWTFVIFRKIASPLRFWLKYQVFKKKYNESEVARLWDYYQAGLTTDQVKKFLLTHGFALKKADELCYIYNQIKLKGGTKNE